MAIIGTFKPDKDGYSGTIRTLSINVRVRFMTNDRKGASSAPDYRLFAGPAEIGAAWRKTAQDSGVSYLSVSLDDPALPEPIRAALMEPAEDGVLRLVWRREKREGA